jgi:GTP-binding protein
LKALFILLDARLPPQASDREMAAFAVSLNLPLVPVLMKTDVCAKRELAQTFRSWQSLAGGEGLLCASAKAGTGMGVLRQRIFQLLCGQ